MIGIEIKFSAGRFHATPWGRHANEAQPEWPPSPWRFLRSLIATWKRKCPQFSEDEIRAIFDQIVEPPKFVLPPATRSHTRHYMPWFKKGPLDKTLIFDSFIVVEKDQPLTLLWTDSTLPEASQPVFQTLLENLNTFGRAESWVIAQLLSDKEAEERICQVNAYPISEKVGADHSELKNRQAVPLLCPDEEFCFANQATPKFIKKEGRGKKAIIHETPIYDPDWALCFETLDLHANNMIDPPGSKWVSYLRPSNAFSGLPKNKPSSNRSKMEKPQIARFLLDSSVLPLLTDALTVAEDARWNIMGCFGRMYDKRTSEVFSGKSILDGEATPLKGHKHAFYLCTDEDNDGRLDHLTIMARDGFGDEEMRVLDSIRRINSRARDKSGHELQLMLMGLGTLSEYKPKICRSQTRFISETPFLAHRHLKTRGRKKDTPEQIADSSLFLSALLKEELERWIDLNGYKEEVQVADIKITPMKKDGIFRLNHKRGQPRPVEFKRFRRKRSDDGGRRLSGFFEIEFPTSTPISGPITLGHSSHFGLGLFVPADS